MRLLVRNGLKMIWMFLTTYHFSWTNNNTQVLVTITNFLTANYYHTRKSLNKDLLLNQINTTSLNKLNSIVFDRKTNHCIATITNPPIDFKQKRELCFELLLMSWYSFKLPLHIQTNYINQLLNQHNPHHV